MKPGSSATMKYADAMWMTGLRVTLLAIASLFGEHISVDPDHSCLTFVEPQSLLKAPDHVRLLAHQIIVLAQKLLVLHIPGAGGGERGPAVGAGRRASEVCVWERREEGGSICT